MKKVFLVAIFFLLTVSARAQDFREISWGMTVEKVKEIEDGKILDENASMFVYAVNLAGHDALLFYRHKNNLVYGGGYSFQARHSDENEYITDYQELKALLIDQYGAPDSDEMLWKNDLYKDDLAHRGRAVGQGDLVYWADWDAGNTKIELALHGKNDLHVLAMNYASAAYTALQGN